LLFDEEGFAYLALLMGFQKQPHLDEVPRHRPSPPPSPLAPSAALPLTGSMGNPGKDFRTQPHHAMRSEMNLSRKAAFCYELVDGRLAETRERCDLANVQELVV